MKITKFNKIVKEAIGSIAIHFTSEEAKHKILESGKFIPSEYGWRGPGVYAHVNGSRSRG